MKVAAELEAAFLAHARWCAPEEACGLLATDTEGAIRFFYPITNRDAAPESYTLDPREMLSAANHAESLGWQLGGVMHSHPVGRAYPSATDVRLAAAATWLHVIVSKNSYAVFRIAPGRVVRM